MRFNKRGVHGPGEFDWDAFLKATTNTLIRDAAEAIDLALDQPEVNPDSLFVHGWSQGAQVATHVALQHPEVRGVALHGPPTRGWSGLLEYQHLDVALPFLKEELDQDADGKLSPAELSRIPQGPVSFLNSFYQFYAIDSTPEVPVLNPELDRNGDGLLDIESELRPAVEKLVGDPGATPNPFINPANEPDRQIHEVVDQLTQPVLVLHGEKDGWVPLADGQTIADQSERVTLKTYQGLGHSLSPTEQLACDSQGVMAQQPIDDLATWILAHS